MEANNATLLQAIRKFQAGISVDDSFRIIFFEYHEQVLRFFRRKGLPEEQCHDLTQEVFFSVYKGMVRIREVAAFQGWLFRIAHNVFVAALTHQHAKKRTAVEVLVDVANDETATPAVSVPDTAPDALTFLLQEEKINLLRNAVNKLPNQMRRCVTARIVEGRSFEDIARELNISANTVRVHLFKAREQLSRELSATFGEIEI
ncbi:MAG TPA: sigma-70 family RNA polymerase sigma factor [Bryobacteraceae bacterium]|jgi:RNA polymerase sigma-70 factor (ECF subfamily)|nr:sigma-70 family RNA polymerase sigma factor [Bryobacteraceae bacterium]